MVPCHKNPSSDSDAAAASPFVSASCQDHSANNNTAASPPEAAREVEEEQEPVGDSDSEMPRFFTKAKSVLSASYASSSTRPRSPSEMSSASLDRGLFHKLEEITTELERLSRLSDALPQSREIEVVQGDLKRVERNSCMMIQSQRDLLDKIERQERSSFRRYLVFNREQKVESLKVTLWERMSETASLDRELQHLERRSDTLLEARKSLSTRGGAAVQVETVELTSRIEELEKERQDVVDNLLYSIGAPETKQLSTRIAMYVSEIRASESIQKQVERCWAMYRDALRNLQAALSLLLSPTYSGTLKEFVTGPYLMAVEAGHQVEAAALVLQPEARRRYRTYAPDLLNVRPPKFPQAVMDFAKRARVNYDRKSPLSVEGTRKLHVAENVVVMMHRIVIQKLVVINQWRSEVEQDLARATEAHRRAEARLQQQMNMLARSVSA